MAYLEATGAATERLRPADESAETPSFSQRLLRGVDHLLRTALDLQIDVICGPEARSKCTRHPVLKKHERDWLEKRRRISMMAAMRDRRELQGLDGPIIDIGRVPEHTFAYEGAAESWLLSPKDLENEMDQFLGVASTDDSAQGTGSDNRPGLDGSPKPQGSRSPPSYHAGNDNEESPGQWTSSLDNTEVDVWEPLTSEEMEQTRSSYNSSTTPINTVTESGARLPYIIGDAPPFNGLQNPTVSHDESVTSSPLTYSGVPSTPELKCRSSGPLTEDLAIGERVFLSKGMEVSNAFVGPNIDENLNQALETLIIRDRKFTLNHKLQTLENSRDDGIKRSHNPSVRPVGTGVLQGYSQLSSPKSSPYRLLSPRRRIAGLRKKTMKGPVRRITPTSSPLRVAHSASSFECEDSATVEHIKPQSVSDPEADSPTAAASRKRRRPDEQDKATLEYEDWPSSNAAETTLPSITPVKKRRRPVAKDTASMKLAGDQSSSGSESEPPQRLPSIKHPYFDNYPSSESPRRRRPELTDTAWLNKTSSSASASEPLQTIRSIKRPYLDNDSSSDSRKRRRPDFSEYSQHLVMDKKSSSASESEPSQTIPSIQRPYFESDLSSESRKIGHPELKDTTSLKVAGNKPSSISAFEPFQARPSINRPYFENDSSSESRKRRHPELNNTASLEVAGKKPSSISEFEPFQAIPSIKRPYFENDSSSDSRKRRRPDISEYSQRLEDDEQQDLTDSPSWNRLPYSKHLREMEKRMYRRR
ncbi:MAG: hypothetical protein M1837_006116 [Sclerophora amabilis]|nr:MAG: hypothetical protein M1837_006116 [Sclerophora amabilis]